MVNISKEIMHSPEYMSDYSIRCTVLLSGPRKRHNGGRNVEVNGNSF